MSKPQINFFTDDRDGERWLINGPELVIANRPKQKGKKMARPRPGTKAWMSYIRTLRKPSKNRHSRKRHHTRAKKNEYFQRNFYSAGETVNRPRTRTVTRYVKVKRNPPKRAGLMGFSFPGIEPIAGAFAGLAVPPVLNYFIGPYIPAAITGNKFGKYAVQAIEVALPSWLVRKYVNRNVGNIMMIAGFGKLLFDAVREFAPGIPGLSGMGYQPMLGYYPARRALPNAVPLMQAPMISGMPDRLNPAGRF